MSKLKSISLVKMELAFGIVNLALCMLFANLNMYGFLTLSSSVVLILFIISYIMMREKHVYFKEKPLLFALSLFYKIYAYFAAVFILNEYPGRDIVVLILMILTVVYMVLSYINQKQYKEMLNAYLYFMYVSIFMYVHFLFNF